VDEDGFLLSITMLCLLLLKEVQKMQNYNRNYSIDRFYIQILYHFLISPLFKIVMIKFVSKNTLLNFCKNYTRKSRVIIGMC
jgi:hypothetical protein